MEEAQVNLGVSQALESNIIINSHSHIGSRIIYKSNVIFSHLFMYSSITLFTISTNISLDAYYVLHNIIDTRGYF